jgi:DNA-binding PadR family transcriptional regulator
MKRPSPKEFLILRQLASCQAGLYGLEIVDQSQGQIKRGTVYVYLNRLSEHRLVSSEKAQPPKGQGGMPRPIYKLTGQGQQVLNAEEAYHLRLAEGLS